MSKSLCLLFFILICYKGNAQRYLAEFNPRLVTNGKNAGAGVDLILYPAKHIGVGGSFYFSDEGTLLYGLAMKVMSDRQKPFRYYGSVKPLISNLSNTGSELPIGFALGAGASRKFGRIVGANLELNYFLGNVSVEKSDSFGNTHVNGFKGLYFEVGFVFDMFRIK